MSTGSHPGKRNDTGFWEGIESSGALLGLHPNNNPPIQIACRFTGPDRPRCACLEGLLDGQCGPGEGQYAARPVGSGRLAGRGRRALWLSQFCQDWRRCRSPRTGSWGKPHAAPSSPPHRAGERPGRVGQARTVGRCADAPGFNQCGVDEPLLDDDLVDAGLRRGIVDAVRRDGTPVAS
jgi:hypothetical protein